MKDLKIDINAISKSLSNFYKDRISSKSKSLSKLNLDNFNKLEQIAKLKQEKVEKNDFSELHTIRNAGSIETDESEVVGVVSGSEEVRSVPGESVRASDDGIQSAYESGLSEERSTGSSFEPDLSTLDNSEENIEKELEGFLDIESFVETNEGKKAEVNDSSEKDNVETFIDTNAFEEQGSTIIDESSDSDSDDDTISSSQENDNSTSVEIEQKNKVLPSSQEAKGIEKTEVKSNQTSELDSDSVNLTAVAEEAEAEPSHIEQKPTTNTKSKTTKAKVESNASKTVEELSIKDKFKANINAIQIIKSGVNLTGQDRASLNQYSGWGGLSKAFFKPNGESHKGWESESAILSSVLTDNEYEQARSSTMNAHYTPDSVIKNIWNFIESSGFTSGRILEPSAGVGGFIKETPHDIKKGSMIDAVELDSMTSKILSGIYSNDKQVKVFNTGFQDFRVNNGVYDVVLGNPPFGQVSLYDKDRKHLNNMSIHNYFFAKSIEVLKDNGLMVMVVSSYLMDAKNSKSRDIIGKKANLVGAIRLPNSTFKKMADAEVTTDILFLQKVPEGFQTNINEWSELGEVNGLPINKYFENNPKNLLGDHVMTTGAFRESTALVPRDGLDVNQSTLDIVKGFSSSVNEVSNTYIDIKSAVAKKESDYLNDPVFAISKDKKAGTYFVVNDDLYLTLEYQTDEDYQAKSDPYIKVDSKLNSKNEEVALKPIEIEKLKGMVGISDLANELRLKQVDNDATDSEIEDLRSELNQVYDAFVKKYGFLNGQTNKALFRDDLNSPLLLSLEKEFDKGISSAVAKKMGMSSRKASAEKSDIFIKRTQYPRYAPTTADSTQDALLISLSEKGEVDMDYIAELVNNNVDDVIQELLSSGLVFYNDFEKEYVTRENYLSGNVKKKFSQTMLPENKHALKEVFPTDLTAAEISVQLGANWVPEEFYIEFITKVTDDEKPKLVFHAFNSQWELNAVDSLDKKIALGTERRSPSDLLEALMNGRTIEIKDTITDENGKKKQVLNKEQTMIAIQKAEQITAMWKDWIYQDEERRSTLENLYNEKFNVYNLTKFDGSHLELPGKVSDEIFEFRPHQKNGVWRVLQGGTTLFDHTVGTGKTATSIGSVMELRRTGKAQKALIVVPNHLVSQWGKEFMELYPNANILLPEKKDFEKNRRRVLMSRMMTGDYDAIIIGHSQLMKIENDPEVESGMIQNELYLLDDIIKNSNSDMTIKRIENRMANLKERMKILADAERDAVNFSEIGIDAMFIDEAHEFKNLTYQTSMTSVGGLGNPTGSKKAFDLYVKTEALLQKTKGNNLVFLTGTPISNSIAEMYTLQRYLARDELSEKGIENFDSWAKAFAEVVTDWELTATMKYKLKSRLSKFNNMPELISMYKIFSDVITREMVQEQLEKQGKKLPVPNMVGGRQQNIVAPRSDIQAEYIGEEISGGGYTPGSLIHRAESGKDIMLKIISDARKCALDMRIIDSNYEDFEDSKVNISLRKAVELYHQFEEDKGTQLIFCDLSTPKASVSREKALLTELIADSESDDHEVSDKAQKELARYSMDDIDALMSSFSVYDDAREKLIKAGIPENEIAFIHDANTDIKKQLLFLKVNSGDVRFLIGSTSKMGAGMNVQERLVGLHHFDAPWRPSDLEQREGRIIRQGNKLVEKYGDSFEVYIGRYATKLTLDSMMWQIIETKARFIEQVRTGDLLDRQVEDLEGQSATAAEMKAASSGNPLILDEMKIRQEIKKLETLKDGFLRQRWSIESSLKQKKNYIENFDKRAPLIKEDIENIHQLARSFALDSHVDKYIKNNSTKENIITVVEAVASISEDEMAGIDAVKRLSMEDFKGVIDDVEYNNENREVFGKKIIQRFRDMDSETECVIGQVHGFDVHLEKDTPYYMIVSIKGAFEHKFENPIISLAESSGHGITSRIINTLNKVESNLENSIRNYDRFVKEVPTLEKGLEGVFDKDNEINNLKEKHSVILTALQEGATSLEEVEEKDNSMTN